MQSSDIMVRVWARDSCDMDEVKSCSSDQELFFRFVRALPVARNRLGGRDLKSRLSNWENATVAPVLPRQLSLHLGPGFGIGYTGW